MAATTYLALVKAEYDYAATSEEEISISEDQVLYVLEYTDDDWWKVRVKISPTEGLSPEEAPTGLVPSTYVTPLQPIKQATALYDYEATSEEEITIKEDVVYDLFEEDGDWTLVGARDKKEVGYAPTAYLEIGGEAATNGHSEEANIPAPPPAPPLPTAAATSANTPRKTNGATTDKVLTWSGVTELEGKKKKKGTLGIGNGALFFASDSDKAPVQKKDLSILKDIVTEKGKQIKLYFTNGELLQFTVSKDDMEAISSKIESSREFAQNGGASQGAQEEEDEEEEDTYVPPPPPPPPTSGGGAKAFGFLPPPPRRMVSSDSEDSDDDDEPPRRSTAGNGSSAIPAAPPPPPAPPAPLAPPAAVPQAPRAPVIPVAPPAPPAATTSARASASGGKRAKAEYDFTASEPEELSLTEGETLYVLDDSAEDWWKVRNERGEEGEVPASYVELLEDSTSAAAGPSAVDEDADEEAARRLQEEEKAEARRERERLRLKKLEEEARGIGAFDFKPPPARKSTASSSADTAAAARAVAATSAPSPPPPPPAPPVMASPPPSAPVRQESKDQHDAVREQRRERHRQRELQREREKAQAQSPVLPVEKTKPSPSRVRTWSDRTGAFKVDAEFVGLSGNKNEKIRLHKLNGVVIEVPLDKMSAEDIRLVEHMVRKKLASSSSSSATGPGGDRHRSERHRAREADQQSQSQQHRARPPSATTASRRAPASSTSGRKDQTDWFEWFLNAGCDIDDCERYARNFEKDRIDVDIVGDLEVGTLRSLGLREGDIIRVRKFIAKKTGGTAAGSSASASASAGSAGTSRGPPPPDKDPSSDREQQLHEDEELARKLQEEMNAGRDGSGLFTSSSGGVKNTRRGRPQPKSAPSAVSFDSIASSLTAGGIDRTTTPGSERVVSPDTTKESSSRRARADSNLISSSSGFDDDAWTVKPSPSNAKSASPVLIDTGSSSSSARATPSPAPQTANSGRDLAGLRNQTASPAMPTSSKEASSAQALTDAYLDSIGLGKRSVTEYGSGHPGRQTASPAPPAPAPPQQQQPQQQQPQQTGYVPQNQMSPQQTGYYQQQQSTNGPRAPPAPIPLNQQLLNPLIPTQTGMTGFIPTRNQQSPMPMMPQHTSFIQPQQTSYQQQPQQPMQTGFPGQSPFGNQFAVQQQPQQPMMQQQPQYGGMMQSQPTGYPISQLSHLSMQPTGMPYQATPSPQPQMQMHIPQAPPPPPMPVQPQQTQQVPSSSQASDFQPANVFAKMKAGQFAKPDSSAQSQQKYDALRPQPTSFGGMLQQPQQMQPQPTGFPNQMQPLQAQPTGFAPGGYISMPQQQQPNMMYPQQTGYPYRPY